MKTSGSFRPRSVDLMRTGSRAAMVETLVRTLKALDSLDGLKMLVPEATFNPLDRLRSAKVRQRARQLRRAERGAR
jgi:hypothetical protein